MWYREFAVLRSVLYANGIEPLGTMLVYIGAIPVVGAVIGFMYFMVVAPEKLQSEDYQIRHETLELINKREQA